LTNLRPLPKTVAYAGVLATVASLAATAAAQGVSVSGGVSAPSIANAKRATRSELLLTHQLLDAHVTHQPVTLTIGCKPVTSRLFRCSFFGEVSSDRYVYVLTGRSNVRFSKTTARATLYDISCNTWSFSNDVNIDFCTG
jgi:hypothetical protein